MHAVILSNGGGAAYPFCLDVLQMGQGHHAPGSLGAGCGPPGERLALRTPEPGFIIGSDPQSMAMTPEGRLFVADNSGGFTVEYTADLAYVQHFEHPVVAQLSPFASTRGVTYDHRTETLWWLNMESSGFDIRRTMLLEGTLAGVATGRRITLQVPTGTPPAPAPAGGAFDPAANRFYFLNTFTGVAYALWGVDTAGVVIGGYPLALQQYPDAQEGLGLDVHGGVHGPDEVRLEVPVALAGEAYWSRVVVTDPGGEDFGMETQIPQFPAGWRAGLSGTALRSRTDPNGVLYGAFTGFDAGNIQVRGLFAFRPIPLSPSWLFLSDWSGAIPAGGNAPVPLNFRAGQREPGEYRSTLVVEDPAGAVLASVPLTLVVTPDTPAEPGPDRAGASLTVWPNPARGAATVTLTLSAPARARVAVHDLLGREVRVIHVGSLPAGTTRLALNAVNLPAGLYLVRAAGAGAAPRRFIVAR